MKDYKDFGIEIPYGRVSRKIKTFCPQCHDTRHDKRDKSLSVDLDKGVWKCHYCGYVGGLNSYDHNDPEERRQEERIRQ